MELRVAAILVRLSLLFLLGKGNVVAQSVVYQERDRVGFSPFKVA